VRNTHFHVFNLTRSNESVLKCKKTETYKPLRYSEVELIFPHREYYF